METKYKVDDTIYWYCDIEQRVHHGVVQFVNYAGAGYPDINYEVEAECCGKKKIFFIDEYDAMDSSEI